MADATQHHALEDAWRALDIERSFLRRGTKLVVVSAERATEQVWALRVRTDVPFPARGWVGAALVRRTDDVEDPADPSAPEPFRAEVLEADADTDTLFVGLADDEDPPDPGVAWLYPFDFLAPLARIRHEEALAPLRRRLGPRLDRVTGRRPPSRIGGPTDLLPALHHDWALLWGPPGTGKTYTLVQQAAVLLTDPSERVLLVSNTHTATDEIARRLGTRLRDQGQDRSGVARLGRVRDPRAFATEGLLDLLRGMEVDTLDHLEILRADLDRAQASGDPTARALAQRALDDALAGLPTLSQRLHDPRLRVAITTAYSALSALTARRDDPEGPAPEPPFTTVIVDEASLVPRLAAAALSLLASRRVVLVGDPRQLSPIAQAARSMPRQVRTWLSRSGLDHLGDDTDAPHVHRLLVQRRMHPHIRAAVSAYAYGGILRDGPEVPREGWPDTGPLSRLPRALGYVLDAHTDRPAALASAPGPDGRSRVRPLIREVLERLLAHHPALAEAHGLFLSPYRAQCELVGAWLRGRGLSTWTASTVHAQQGSEADVVVFDTVHASSTGWDPAEWTRLVNVGLSRARQLVVLVASRSELEQPWLRRLKAHLTLRVLRPRGEGWRWDTLSADAPDPTGLFRPTVATPGPPAAAEPDPVWLPEVMAAEDTDDPAVADTLGLQIRARQRLRPVMSHEQARLVQRDLHDAGPRLVRGVAGSGKTLVLAHWAVRALQGLGVPEVAVVYANRALRPLLMDMLDRAWQGQDPPLGPTPWHRIQLHHVGDLLADLEREHDQPTPTGRDRFDYATRAARLLDGVALTPRFPALFLDEAQDFGHDTLALLLALTEPSGPDGRRPVLIFYDNGQDLYRRGPPRWRDLGLDLRGRSDVMRESFRSTRPNTELALDVLHHLRDLHTSPDLRELMRPGPGGRPPALAATPEGHWQARFCSVDGQAPHVHVAADRADEDALIARQVRKWITEDHVDPGQIRILTLGGDRFDALTGALRRALPAAVPVLVRKSQGFADCDHAVVLTTPHSFKGHDAELVVVAGADRFVARGQILHTPLWVAMTRARTLLLVTATEPEHPDTPAARIVEALRWAADRP